MMQAVQCGCCVFVDNIRRYLPQVSLQAHATILSSAARTTLTQTYVNSFGFILEEASYTFPLYDGVSVVGFKCRVGTRLLHSTVKSKEQANTDYKAAVERNELAAIMDHTSEDVFSIRLGNVPANEKVTVEITYIGDLKQDAQLDGLRYTLPNSIAPRYGTPSPFARSSSERPAELDSISIIADIVLEKTAFIREIQSLSHSPKVSLGRISSTQTDSCAFEPSQASAILRFDKDNQPFLSKDFVLVVKADGLDNPRALLESHPTLSGQRAIMATLVPKFKLPVNKPEIIFVIDRSGSMRGKIPTLRAALRVFLKSLPVGVCFNICSFGSSHSMLWSKSIVYDRASLEHALSFVDTIHANMGGTEIYSAVEAVFQNRLPDKDLEVLLLTDGQIYNQQELFRLVRDSTAAHTARLFALGIGDAASHSLIEGVARAGQGFAQSVLKNEELDRCVMEVDYEHSVEQDFEVLNIAELSNSDTEMASNSPTVETPSAPAEPISLFAEDHVDDETIEGSDAAQKEAALPDISPPKVIQAPHNIPPLYPFIRSTVYLLLDPESSDKIPRSLTFSATSKQGPLCLRIPITDLGRGETIHQLASRKAVIELEELHGWLGEFKDENGNRFDQLHHNTKERLAARECQSLGIKYQVTGKYCSFVALENGTEVPSQPKEEQVMENQPISRLAASPAQFSSQSLCSSHQMASEHNNALMSPSSDQHKDRLFPSRRVFGSSTYIPPAMRSATDAHSLSQAARGPPIIASTKKCQMPSRRLSGDSSRPPAPPPAPAAAFGAASSGGLFGVSQARPPLPAGGGAPPPPPPPGPLFGSVSNSTIPPSRTRRSVRLKNSDNSSLPISAAFMSFTPSAVDASPALPSPGSLFGSPYAAPIGEFAAMRDCRPVPASRRSAPEAPKSKLHALVELQTFEGNWTWGEDLLSILGYDMEAMRTKISNMLQNDGKAYLPSDRENDVIATLLAMGWLTREHNDSKDVWELLFEKADTWVKNEVEEMKSELFNDYTTDVWMSLQ
ncbi:hypothetical protein N7493_011705 [Penicillium malachiteum]|uniref:von Willebrand factor, type A n=1 Tax=Penicillium malachiteum TaxID=1324776 RepID=A0AAD6HAA5_9EURO|nr:hypothetical protein N7493_011705 [Penicillium malachiteum]